MVLAKYHGRTVAGGVFFQFGGKALFKYGAADRAFQELRPSNLVMWEAIRALGRRGCKTLNFGRTSKNNEGLRRFKRGWGSAEQELVYCRYDLRKAAFVSDKDRSVGWHTQVFKITPLWLARLIGSVVYGRLA
jgi:lipid II:glycine glycyltransferase (peptidoglycan interpeptide bridge formation enzyme)